MNHQENDGLTRPGNVDISSWREHPQSQWSFQNVRQLIPTAAIQGSARPVVFKNDFCDFTNMIVESPRGSSDFKDLLHRCYTDSLLVLHHGEVVMEWSAAHGNPSSPHIVFSISKSITAMLAGILEEKGVIDSEAPIIEYLPGVRASVYADCTVRNLLDMTVALNFEENYTDRNSEYIQYRKSTAWNPVDLTALGPGLETFLYSLSKSNNEHGQTFLYRSPNSDLLGLILEHAAGEPLANLFSKYLWQPMGATSEGYITVDRYGAPRAAGGICITLHDLARIGQLFLTDGMVNGKPVISSDWIEDTRNNGDQLAWDRGNYKQKLPNYRYRNKWYLAGDADRTICARGIHGQLLYINPARKVVIARMSSHPDPLNDADTGAVMTAFEKIARQYQ